MNADRVISKINYEMNTFNESGSREDKACAEGLRRARTYIQQEVLKRKILTHDQQVVLEWLKNQHFDSYIKSVLSNLYFYVNLTAVGDLESKEITAMVAAYKKLSQQEFAQVLQAYANWALEQEDE